MSEKDNKIQRLKIFLSWIYGYIQASIRDIEEKPKWATNVMKAINYELKEQDNDD